MKTYMKIAAVGTSVFLSACTADDTVLFASGANVGIDADGAKQSINVGIERYEVVTAPTYANASAPPVYARLESNGGYFTPVVTSLHATGHAALIAAKRTNAVSMEPNTSEFDLIDYNAIDKNLPKRRVFFGTSTNGGLKIGFSQARPPSFNFGIKRQELSILPLTPKIKSDKKSVETGQRVYGSLIGRLDFGGRTKSMRDLGIELKQYIATGQAAVATANCVEIDSNGQIKKSTTCNPGLVRASMIEGQPEYATTPGGVPAIFPESAPRMKVEQAPVLPKPVNVETSQ